MRRLLLLVLLTAGVVSLPARTSLLDSIIAHGDTLTLTLDTDWKQLLRHKTRKQYQPATVDLGPLGQFRGKVRTRGNVRLQQCQNPSLRIKIPKATLRAAGLAELNHLKLVLPCYDRESGETYLRREKLVYELHEAVSPYYLRTHPIWLRSPDGEHHKLAFLIEDARETAARYDARLMQPTRLGTRGLQRKAYLRLCLFNYLVLNTDWYIYNRHNLLCINPNGTKDLIVIPYDFDYSGFVGTTYAVPHESLDQRDIYQPLFRGRFVTAPELARAAEPFLRQRDTLRTIIDEYPGLTRRDRKRLQQYLDDFYRTIGSDAGLRQLVRQQSTGG